MDSIWHGERRDARITRGIEQAERYRNLAQQVREVAEDTRGEEKREILLAAAHELDGLARGIERQNSN
jgi:hypothetical protein